MNMWLLDIAQIQRRPLPPLDIPEQYDESETLFACAECGQRQPEENFYLRMNRQGKYRRAVTCKSCEARKNKAYRDSNPVTKREKQAPTDLLILNALAKESMIVSEIAEAVGRHRRPVDKALVKLIEDGLVEVHGYKIIPYHPRVMKYRLTTTGDSNG